MYSFFIVFILRSQDRFVVVSKDMDIDGAKYALRVGELCFHGVGQTLRTFVLVKRDIVREAL